MGKNRPISAHKFRELTVIVRPYNDIVWGFLESTFAAAKGAEELVGRAARVTSRTARNWLRKECSPHGEHLLDLMASCDDFRDQIMAEVAARKLKYRGQL